MSPAHALKSSVCLSAFCAFTCLLLASGCSTFDLSQKFDLNKRIPWMDTDAIVKQPTRLTALWTQTVLNQAGQKGVRGFGGRIMFHAKDGEKPVRVDGTLTIYAFNESSQTVSTPERKFVFTSEQFANHYSMTKLGHSYSIWLPWDEVGGPPHRISLLARFEPVEGSMIMSETSMQNLPGIPRENDDGTNEPGLYDESSAIQQTSYLDHGGSNISKGGGLTTSGQTETINLPPSFGRRLNSFGGSADDYDNSSEASAIPKSGIEPQRLQTSNRKADTAGTGKAVDPFEDNTSSDYSGPAQSLMERQKELARRFGRKKPQVRKASFAEQDHAARPNSLSLEDESSSPQQSSKPGKKDPVD